MQYVEFKDGLKFSRFGFGALRFPKLKDEEGNPLKDEQGNEIIDEPASISFIRAAIDGGINIFDSAHSYPNSERILGLAFLDGYRQKVNICTKLPIAKVTCPEDAERFFNEELERLQTDYVDIYLLHNLSKPNYEIALKNGVIDYIQGLKRDGKVKYIGFSLHDSFEHFKTLVDNHPWDAVMLQYNYYDRDYQAGVRGVKYAYEKGISVFTMESLRGGMLGGDVPQPVVDSFGDFMPGTSSAHKGFAWLYNQPEVSVIFSGLNSLERLNEDLEIFKHAKVGAYSPQDEHFYDAARAAWAQFVNVGCTDCKYCMPCPAGVDIPGTFKVWNDYAKSKHQGWLYGSMISSRGHGADKCIDCGKCNKACPQEFDIPTELRRAHEELTPKG